MDFKSFFKNKLYMTMLAVGLVGITLLLVSSYSQNIFLIKGGLLCMAVLSFLCAFVLGRRYFNTRTDNREVNREEGHKGKKFVRGMDNFNTLVLAGFLVFFGVIMIIAVFAG